MMMADNEMKYAMKALDAWLASREIDNDSAAILGMHLVTKIILSRARTMSDAIGGIDAVRNDMTESIEEFFKSGQR
jgi:hypothetical protein